MEDERPTEVESLPWRCLQEASSDKETQLLLSSERCQVQVQEAPEPVLVLRPAKSSRVGLARLPNW